MHELLTMEYVLPTSPYWQFALGRIGEVVTGTDEIEQALRILMTTQPGSVPGRPELGCDTLQWVDRSPVEALPGLIRVVSKAIARWEPRVKVLEIKVQGAGSSVAVLRVSWRPMDHLETIQETSISVGLGQSAAIGTYAPSGLIGRPNGVLPLGEDRRIPAAYLPTVSPDPSLAPSSVDLGEIL